MECAKLWTTNWYTHWANTFMSAPVFNKGDSSMKTPPVYLLIWFAYSSDLQLRIVDRTTFGLHTTDCPIQLLYVLTGKPEKVSKKYLP